MHHTTNTNTTAGAGRREAAAPRPDRYAELRALKAQAEANGNEGDAAFYDEQIRAAQALDRALAPETPKAEAKQQIRKAERLTGRRLVATVVPAPRLAVTLANRDRKRPMVRAFRREHRPGGTRRESSSSRTGGQDPGGDDEPDPALATFPELHPVPAIRGQLSLWGFEPRIGGRR